MNSLFNNPTTIRDMSDRHGTQRLYYFDNGYGASVIRHDYSYGGPEGLWELAVIEKSTGEKGFRLTYDTPVTDDVEGQLTEEEVEALLKQIKELPHAE